MNVDVNVSSECAGPSIAEHGGKISYIHSPNTRNTNPDPANDQPVPNPGSSAHPSQVCCTTKCSMGSSENEYTNYSCGKLIKEGENFVTCSSPGCGLKVSNSFSQMHQRLTNTIVSYIL